MQKQQSDWQAVRIELNEKLLNFHGRPKELADSAGINYFSARRFIVDGVKNCNANARKLCKHFGVGTQETAKQQISDLEMLTGLIDEVWDGSASHAKLIAGLIESTRPFKISKRVDGKR
jgi:hypothetical protein